MGYWRHAALLVMAVVVAVVASVAFGFGGREEFASPFPEMRESLRNRWLSYTLHAKSRMKERGITKQDVESTVRYAGEINPYASRPPSRYSVEANLAGRRIRVVLAPRFYFFAYVVTVIQL